ncbi:N-formylglutamate amidohydrolase [Thioclava atlantica]|uniref:N-formylglutamate amidohydrolase n=1 Tax=Thioclava atlantica TaxID=1317124 RepID=A0A085TSY2_9RHOB|nr:N-formylglutamate amidohydrolase [Thioclava atlantica]KFE33829.1 N-formylglutamate amidohydrolase [Thioclava atlantica]
MSTKTAAIRIEGAERSGRFVIICEHASNAMPAPWGDLGLDAAQRAAHIAWDPGALGLAWGLAEVLHAPLAHACQSRLIYDLNRPPHHPGAMPERSEIHAIPGNAGLDAQARLARTEELYLPFHAELRALIARRLARGEVPILVTVHSFTPVYFGQRRSVELGVIHDRDPGLARAVLEEAQARTGLDARLNEPYSAADGVTHTLALQATPMGLPNVMLEVRNDLIADAAAQQAMAAQLAPVLSAARARIETTTGEAA